MVAVCAKDHPLFSSENLITFGEQEILIGDLPQGVTALPLSRALKIYGTFLQERLSQLKSSESDLFASEVRNQAKEPLVLYIAPGTKVKRPLRLLHLSSGGKSYDALHVFVGKGAEVSLVCHALSVDGACQQISCDISLGEGARVTHLQHCEPGNSSWLLGSMRAQLAERSFFTSLTTSFGGKAVRNRFEVELQGKHAEAILQGVAMVGQSRHHHTHVTMRHLAPETRSTQLFKNVLKESSRTSFEGKIFVDRLAQKTEAYQRNNNLLLNDSVIANSKPNLEIFADDVKASHGATVQLLEAESLFYLQSRGIDKEAAKGLLLKSFCQELLFQIPEEKWRTYLLSYVEGYAGS